MLKAHACVSSTSSLLKYTAHQVDRTLCKLKPSKAHAVMCFNFLKVQCLCKDRTIGFKIDPHQHALPYVEGGLRLVGVETLGRDPIPGVRFGVLHVVIHHDIWWFILYTGRGLGCYMLLSTTSFGGSYYIRGDRGLGCYMLLSTTSFGGS